MNTEVIMKRELFGNEISQKSTTEFFSATDLVKSGNQFRALNKIDPFNMSEWLRTKSTKEFIESLEKKFNKVIISGRGRGKHTWVHPYLFIDMALAISPELKIEVYAWVYDHLLKYRNDSGDSFKKMSAALYYNCSNKSKFNDGISKTSILIKNACGVKDWQQANEMQLKLRDKIHDGIALLCDILRDNNQAIKIGIKKAIDNQ